MKALQLQPWQLVIRGDVRDYGRVVFYQRVRPLIRVVYDLDRDRSIADRVFMKVNRIAGSGL